MKLTADDYLILRKVQVERQRLRQEAKRLRDGKKRMQLPEHTNNRLDDIAAQIAQLTNAKLAEKFETSVSAIEYVMRPIRERNADD